MTALIDDETARLLERMAADLSGYPPVLTIDDRRTVMRRMALDYGPPPAPVARTADRTIDGPGGPLRLRVYWPAAPSASPPPLLLHIHGGGWAIGDPDAYEPVCRAYCQAAGAIVVDVDYRRAPEDKFPAALNDCIAALAWTEENATTLGADPHRIIVTGDSAGGNLAAALCQAAGPRLAMQILVYPVISAEPDARYESREALGDGRYFLREADIKNAEQEYLADPQQGYDPRVSPLRAADARIETLPPTLIVTAALDPLRDEGAAYAARLQACGVPVEYRCVEGTIHAFVLFAGALAKGAETIALIGERARAAMPIAGGAASANHSAAR